MRVLQNWLREFVPFDLTPDELAERLGMLGLEVESYEELGKKYDGFVVGRVRSVEKHPNADRLTVCTVSTGETTRIIVCGAPNVAAGQKVVVGLPGAIVPRNQHDPSGRPFRLERATIRGVKSEGMICSAAELGIGDDAGGILVLEQNAKEGAPVARHLGLDNVAYDIEVTPNRPDWLGHIGVAREIGIITGQRLKLPRLRVKERGPTARSVVSVRIEDPNLCSRFAVRVIRRITIRESPEWLRNRLEGVGLRPVNNVVDVTNYVMYETGQPLHAFDLAALDGGGLVIREMKKEKPFTTLDGRKVTLPAGAVMVCDKRREVSVAGIMGGANSEISNSTTDVVLEAASWNPSRIRRTARTLGIKTDAAYRFERGTDPNGIPFVLDRAAELINRVAGGEVLRGIVDAYPKKVRERTIGLRADRVNAVLGTRLTPGEVRKGLRPLGIVSGAVGKEKEIYRVPTFRVDLEREIDLIEEVARVFGYDRIPEVDVAAVFLGGRGDQVTTTDRVRQTAVGLGFREIVSFPMIDAGLAPGRAHVRIINPQSAEMNIMRPGLLPGLLGSVARNIRRGNPDLRLFEIGHVFWRDPAGKGSFVGDIREEERLGIALSGRSRPLQWGSMDRSVDPFDLKGVVEMLLATLSLDKCRFISYSTSDSLVEEAIGIETHGAYAGYLGRVSGEFLKLFEIEQPVFVAELRMISLERTSGPMYIPLPRFPRVRRDVSYVLDSSIPAEQVGDAILSASSGLLSSARLFDLHTGDPLPAGKKGLTYSLELIPTDRTLTDQEIDHEVARATRAVEERFGAVLRS